jgi:hypothetical protein
MYIEKHPTKKVPTPGKIEYHPRLICMAIRPTNGEGDRSHLNRLY